MDRIERETLIAAPVERVFALVAEPGFWAAEEANLTGKAGVVGETTVVADAKDSGYPVRVEEVRPTSYVAYRWVSAFPGEDLREDNSTLVEFFLTEEDSRTRLRVVESGFAALPTTEDNLANVVKDHTEGWLECIALLTTRAERSPV